MSTILLTHFAATYGDNSYNTSTYGGSTTQTTTGADAGGGLSNTGIAVASFVTIACVVLLVAVIVRFWRRSAKNTNTNPEV